MFIKNGHLPWCPTLHEPCRCKPSGYAAAAVLALLTAALEFWGSGESGSLSLLGDAWHVTSDIVVYLVAIAAGIIAVKTKSEGRASAIKEKGAMTNANILMVVASVTIVWAALRISHPVEIETDAMLLVSAIGLAANGVMYFLLKAFEIENEQGKHDHLHRTAILHTLNDLGISFVVVAAGKAMEVWPWIVGYHPDSWASILICLWLIEKASKTKREARKAIEEEKHRHEHHSQQT